MHFKQETNYSCGAAATRQILYFAGIELPECFLREKLKTTTKGTYCFNSFNFLKNRLPNREVNIIHDISFERDIKWLDYLSNANILYCSGEFVCGGNRRGRYSHRHHAFVIFKGKIYDPGEKQVYPVEAYFHTFDKELKLNSVILVSVDRIRGLTN